MLHDGQLYHGGDLRRPFLYVTGGDVEKWKSMDAIEFNYVIAGRFALIGLSRIWRRIEKHDGPKWSETFTVDLDVTTDGYTSEVHTLLIARAIEWIHTMGETICIYDEIFLDYKGSKVDRGLFRVTLTLFLYGKKGG